MPGSNRKVIMLLTDGNPTDSPFAAADAAKNASTRIITIGVGDIHPDTLLQASP